MLGKRYFLDKKELVYKVYKPSPGKRIFKFSILLLASVILAGGYGLAFKHLFGAPKEKRLQSELEEIRYKYSLLEKKLQNVESDLEEIAMSEDNVYRPVFNMDKIPGSFRQSGYGGTRKYNELAGYKNSDIMLSARRKTDRLLRKTYIQSRSFDEIVPEAAEWKDKLEHMPFIRPVNVNIPLGDGLMYRHKHPVLGTPRWHHGQDFSAPRGTEVYATGSGTVTRAGWSPYGFGKMVEIDHGYGFVTIYGHLSKVDITAGEKVKRGDLLGLSGSTGISSGPHLHYEVHYYGKVKNPVYYFHDELTKDEYFEMISAFENSASK